MPKRIPLPVLTALFVFAFLGVWAVLIGNPFSTDPITPLPTTTTEDPWANIRPAYEAYDEAPADSTTTTTELPPTTVVTDTAPLPPQVGDGHTEGDLITLEVATWGETIASQDSPLSLRAIGHQPGDQPDTTEINLELCAGEETPLPDGEHDTLDVIMLPDDGVINNAYDTPDYDKTESSLTYPAHTITVDNTPTKVVTGQMGPDPRLVQVLPAGVCTPVLVQVFTADLDKLVIGFAYTTVPFGEWRPNGGFTRLANGAPATSFQFTWYVN